MRIGSYFDIREFIPPIIWQQYGDKSIWFSDKRIFLLADFIRNRFKSPMIINNWTNGGALTLRGFRPSETTI